MQVTTKFNPGDHVAYIDVFAEQNGSIKIGEGRVKNVLISQAEGAEHPKISYFIYTGEAGDTTERYAPEERTFASREQLIASL